MGEVEPQRTGQRSTDATRRHWQRAFEAKEPTEVSWFEAEASASLRLIESAGLTTDSALIDVGGGASRLAASLWERGWRDLTVADISVTALERARESFPADPEQVEWVEADVRDHDFEREFDVWHDRALFHFMVEPADRERYLETLGHSLRRPGQLIVATFAPDGPTSCSSLPVARYGPDELEAAFEGFSLQASERVEHRTPAGTIQPFTFARLRRD